MPLPDPNKVLAIISLYETHHPTDKTDHQSSQSSPPNASFWHSAAGFVHFTNQKIHTAYQGMAGITAKKNTIQAILDDCKLRINTADSLEKYIELIFLLCEKAHEAENLKSSLKSDQSRTCKILYAAATYIREEITNDKQYKDDFNKKIQELKHEKSSIEQKRNADLPPKGKGLDMAKHNQSIHHLTKKLAWLGDSVAIADGMLYGLFNDLLSVTDEEKILGIKSACHHNQNSFPYVFQPNFAEILYKDGYQQYPANINVSFESYLETSFAKLAKESKQEAVKKNRK